MEQIDPPGSGNLVARLQRIFQDVEQYRRLVRCQGSGVQRVLDSFQHLLDTPELDNSFRRSLIVATQRLSKKSGLYPTCYELKDIAIQDQNPITAGGFADIFEGDFEGQPVCLKAIRLYRNREIEHFLKQFSKEAVLWGQLSHPNILPTYGLFRFQNRVCLVSPWMSAGDITEYLRSKPEAARLPLASAVDIAKGLSYLHKNGIIHGDLKGSNILVNNAGIACLADFGLSSVSDPDIPAWTSHSSAASRGGSTRWQAPELFDMENDTTVKNTTASDVYAWSFVCYEVFTGDIPLSHIQRDSTLMLQVKFGARPARPADVSPPWRDWGLTEVIWSIMQDCWKEDPLERPEIEQVISLLKPLTPTDDRSSEQKGILLPTRFRATMGGRLDIISVSDLDELLASNNDTAPYLGADIEAGTSTINSTENLAHSGELGQWSFLRSKPSTKVGPGQKSHSEGTDDPSSNIQPPEEPPSIEVPASNKSGWRKVLRSRKGKKQSRSLQPESSPPPQSGPSSGQRQLKLAAFWAERQPDPAIAPMQPSFPGTSVPPIQILLPGDRSPGLFGPHSPSSPTFPELVNGSPWNFSDLSLASPAPSEPGPSSIYRHPELASSWATWQPNSTYAPSPIRSISPLYPEDRSPKLFGPQSPASSPSSEPVDCSESDGNIPGLFGPRSPASSILPELDGRDMLPRSSSRMTPPEPDDGVSALLGRSLSASSVPPYLEDKDTALPSPPGNAIPPQLESGSSVLFSLPQHAVSVHPQLEARTAPHFSNSPINTPPEPDDGSPVLLNLPSLPSLAPLDLDGRNPAVFGSPPPAVPIQE